MSVWQQQILGQYAMMNGLLGVGAQPPSSKAPSAESPSKRPFQAPQDHNKELMNHHLNQVISSAFRPENGSYVCSVCHSSYTNKGNFKQHIEKHFKNGEFQGINGTESLTAKQAYGIKIKIIQKVDELIFYKCFSAHQQ